MSRLSRYLLVQYARDALVLYAVAAILVFLIQLLRLFDLVTAKGQDLIALAGQAFLATPPLAREIVYICMAIGLARAFRALQQSRELHTIHITRRMSAIFSALVIYMLGGVILVQVLAHWAEPESRRESSEWTAEIAAELVGENLVPRRFTEVAPSVVLRIEGRDPDGTIRGFFADDSRLGTIRRTYIADSAIIVSTPDGYQISLRDGRLQTDPQDDKYSEIAFARYELAIESLTQEGEVRDRLIEKSTPVLLAEAEAAGTLDPEARSIIQQRLAEGPRVLGICLLVAALLAFPHARRGRNYVPFELVVLALAFTERSVSNYLSSLVEWGHYFGPTLLGLAGTALLIYRLMFRARRLVRIGS